MPTFVTYLKNNSIKKKITVEYKNYALKVR